MKVIIDVFGGDNAPVEIVKGSLEAMVDKPELSLVLVGLENEMKAELNKYSYDKSRVELEFATEIITNDESPTEAIKKKKDSTLVRALNLLKERDDIDAMVSAGSTGAVLTGGIFNVGRIKGIRRPAIAATLPTLTGGECCILDCGANVDCKPEFLADFAIMGIGFIKAMCGTENPRVALLSNGAEDKKGNLVSQEAFKLLKEMPINFVGNMEARYAFTGDYDVIVADGFAGNIMIKTIEGTGMTFMKMMKKAMMSSFKSKLGAALLKNPIMELKDVMDYNKKGGAPFVGLEKTIVKAHGSSNALSFKSSIRNACQAVDGNMVGIIKELVEKSKAVKAEVQA